MTTPNYAITPNFTPFLRLIEFQTRFAMEASQGMMKLAMMPWAGLPKGFGSVCTPMGSLSVAVSAETVKAPVTETVVETTDDVIEAVAETVDAATETVETVAETVEDVTVAPVETAEPVAKAVVETVAKKTEAVAPVVDAPKVVEPAEAVTETVETVTEAVEPVTKAAKIVTETVAAPVAAEAAAPAMTKPKAMTAPKGALDDLTVLNGVGPKLAEALNAEGIYKLSQIAAWSKANVAWVDENLPGVRGRASRNGWVAQAAELVK